MNLRLSGHRVMLKYLQYLILTNVENVHMAMNRTENRVTVGQQERRKRENLTEE